jgi:hypothetical protein
LEAPSVLLFLISSILLEISWFIIALHNFIQGYIHFPKSPLIYEKFGTLVYSLRPFLTVHLCIVLFIRHMGGLGGDSNPRPPLYPLRAIG